MLRNRYSNISQYLFSGYLYFQLQKLIFWKNKYSCFKQVVKYNLLCFSVSWPVKVPECIWISFLILRSWQLHQCLAVSPYWNKLERKFWIKLFLTQSVHWIINITWCDILRLSGLYTATCISAVFYISSELCGIS